MLFRSTELFSSRASKAFHLLLTVFTCGFATLFATATAAEPFEMQLRSRVETSEGSGRFHTLTKPEQWNPAKTAIIVCDMWDLHHSRNATLRTGELAPHINELVQAVRKAGGTVLHCPSDCMDFYKDHPARIAAQQAPKAKELPPEIGKWCYSIPKEEQGEYPLDQSDGGGDDDPELQAAWLKELETKGRKPGGPWIKEHEAIVIEPGDFVTDKGDEVWSILDARGIDNILMTGVHTNMCVLGRPFGLRRLASNGKNVVLVRDLTDTMYNPAMRPFVNHFTGNDLIAEHIEKFVCPTVTSDQILGGESHVFQHDDRPHVVMVISEPEYGTERTLPAFAKRHLGRHFKVSLVFGDDADGNELPGLEVLNNADVMLLSMRRRALRPESMKLIREFIEAGKPVVGIRTASHALSLRGKEPPAGYETWESFDADVFGGNYSNHYGVGPETEVSVTSDALEHPILAGVAAQGFTSRGSLYVVSPLKDSATPLLMGKVADHPPEPVAYTNQTNFGGKAFYTSLGHETDFEQAPFRRLLFNALHWATGRDVPKTMPDAEGEGAKGREGEGEKTSQSPLGRDREAIVVVRSGAGSLSAGPTNSLATSRSRETASGVGPTRRLSSPTTPLANSRLQFGSDVEGRKTRRDCDPGVNPAPLSLGRGVGGEGCDDGFPTSCDRTTPLSFEVTPTLTPHPQPLSPEERGAGPLLLASKLQSAIQERETDEAQFFESDISYVSRLSPSPASPDPKAPFTNANDLTLELVLSEPDIGQPVFMDFDERGRLWVVQYLQYPNPAGLTMLSKDKFWRAVYDKVPAAPPNHMKGADKITIHEDTNGDGRFDAQKTFVDGLSIVTSFVRGRGGVWVLNPPYLLFYPDCNNDDVPDSDPEVRLAGFGLEDTHSVANSLRFGPDGWLYACQGSTVSGHITRPGTDDKPVATMGQLIWRYHPETREYEVFAEGGGNAFGLEIDAAGNIYSGHNGGDTRGFHYIQGGYYRKGFEKHGPLSNPHAYGYFEPIQHAKVPRFTHNFIIYEGDSLPETYQGKLLGVEPLQGQVTLTEITPVGSTFATEDLDRVVQSKEGDRFRPVHITTGPDGAIYVADFHEEYIGHREHFEGRIAKDTGRIYRLRATEGEGSGETGDRGTDLSKESSAELVAWLDHPNRWQRQTALRLLADRNDQALVTQLRVELFDESTKRPLERLWAIHQLGGLDDATTLKAVEHADPLIRSWAVRLECDDKSVSPELAERFAALATAEPDIRVRVQLACSARRLPVGPCLTIVEQLLAHADDRTDAFLPLSLWWAVEAHCDQHAEAVLAFATTRDLWSHPLAREVLAERLMQRFASGNRADLVRAATLLQSAPDDATRTRFLAGFETAFRGRSAATLPEELLAALAKSGPVPLSLRLRRGEPAAITEALAQLDDSSKPAADRAELAALVAERHPTEALPVFLAMFDASSDASLRAAALAALAGYHDPSVVEHLMTALPQRPTAEQIAIVSVLVSRADWSMQLVDAVRSGRIDTDVVPIDLARRLPLHGDQTLTKSANEIWPEAVASQTPRTIADLRSLHDVIVASAGDPYRGKRLFNTSCSRCHQLFGEGGDLGPDLTSDPRNDLSRLLGAVAAPSAEIREGFEAYVAVMNDGRILSGLLVDQDEHIVVLREADGRTVLLRRDDIEEFVKQQKSLMPDGLLDPLPDDELRDLFAYLRSSQPLNE